MNRNKITLIILLVLLTGYTLAQVGIGNQLSAGQTDFKTGIENKLELTGQTLSECTPILVNKKGSYIFDTNGTGCPTGVFEINEGELLLKIMSLENRITELEERIKVLEEVKT